MKFCASQSRLPRGWRSMLPALALSSALALVAAPPRMDAQPAYPPAGAEATPEHPWVPVKSIDFSPKHNILIKSEDGSMQPMDQPYFKATLIAPGTWQVLADGDHSYLVEGDNEALVIDSTYGAGNLREYMQTLTKKPVRSIVNTHDHFDHTANNAYFDRAFMSAYTRTKATIPFPSFAGIEFPRNYPVTVIGEGYVFHLGNRDLEVFEIPNHTMGDIALLDRKQRILFSGDVFLGKSTAINGASSVERFASNMRKLAAHRKEFDRLAGGPFIFDAPLVDQYLAVSEAILAGKEGEAPTAGGQPGGGQPGGPPRTAPIVDGHPVYTRRIPHPGDGGAGMGGAPNPNQRKLTIDGVSLSYDITKIK